MPGWNGLRSRVAVGRITSDLCVRSTSEQHCRSIHTAEGPFPFRSFSHWEVDLWSTSFCTARPDFGSVRESRSWGSRTRAVWIADGIERKRGNPGIQAWCARWTDRLCQLRSTSGICVGDRKAPVSPSPLTLARPDTVPSHDRRPSAPGKVDVGVVRCLSLLR